MQQNNIFFKFNHIIKSAQHELGDNIHVYMMTFLFQLKAFLTFEVEIKKSSGLHFSESRTSSIIFGMKLMISNGHDEIFCLLHVK